MPSHCECACDCKAKPPKKVNVNGVQMDKATLEALKITLATLRKKDKDITLTRVIDDYKESVMEQMNEDEINKL